MEVLAEGAVVLVMDGMVVRGIEVARGIGDVDVGTGAAAVVRALLDPFVEDGQQERLEQVQPRCRERAVPADGLGELHGSRGYPVLRKRSSSM